jgi:hypothetical protein
VLGRCDLLAGSLAIDEIARRVFVAVVELLKVKVAGYGVNDAARELDHLLGVATFLKSSGLWAP